jgi:phenylacetate-coenzyme A ligase PaaK-like adenylate-forming protein
MEQVVQAFLDTLRKTQFLPPERLLEHQRGLLERLVRHARAHVPFYRDSGRLDILFRSDDSIAWERWEELPILTRRDVQFGGAGLKAENLPREHGSTWQKHTAGSTGEPLSVTHTDLSGGLAWASVLLRSLERNGIDPTRRLLNVVSASPDKVGASETRRYEAWCPELFHLGIYGERFEIACSRSTDNLVEALVDLRPPYMEVFPSSLQLMVAQDPDRALAQVGLEAVISHGETFEPRAKAEIEDQLGCPIFEFYGCNEAGFLATTCPHCGRFHIESEVVRVELVADGGRIAAPGEAGRVVITPLYNYAMPLIRYSLADVARQGAEGGCSITLPALDQVLGRERAPFVFPGNISIRASLPIRHVIRFLGAHRFQVAQVADDRCEMRIVPGTIAPAEMQFAEMTRLIRSYWWDGLQIDYKIVDSLPENAKPQVFVREMPERTAS